MSQEQESKLKAPVGAVQGNQPTTVPAQSAAERRLAEGKCPICGKSVYRPKDGGVGSTCYEHQGKLRQSATEAQAAPEGWVRMSKVCDAAVAAGLTRGSIVKASGGDACTGPILDPVFNVVYVGRAKFMHPDVLTKGINMLLNPPKVVADKKAPAAQPAKPEAAKSGIAAALKTAVAPVKK